jgi:putative transposase
MGKSLACDDRNVTDPATLRTMITYIHENPVGRGLVQRAADWKWSSAQFYEGMAEVPLIMDPLLVMDG